MTNHTSTAALLALRALGTPQGVLHVPLTGALYLEEMGGPTVSSYWPGPEVANVEDVAVRQRAEMFLVVTAVLSLMRLYARPSAPGRQQEFDNSMSRSCSSRRGSLRRRSQFIY